MSVLGYLQRIGRALMVPVAVLPAAAIMMGVGYWLDPNGWGADSALAAFLIQAGAALIDKMAILFAIGVAYGMSKDKDGAAALAGTSYPIDRQLVADLLGFDGVCENSLDAVSDRDFAIEFCAASALTMMHLSRLRKNSCCG